MKDLHQLSSYQYELPQELIAQHPCEQRDRSRLLVIDRQRETFEEWPFYQLADFLKKEDSLVLNDTEVIPARLFGKRETGGGIELLLSKQLAADTWEVLARPAKKLLPGSKLHFGSDFHAEVVEAREEGVRVVKFFFEGLFLEALAAHGRMPLPSYIRKGLSDKEDCSRYQTVYAAHPGAVAAPTAGLHFTQELLNKVQAKGAEVSKVTLHVGLGTFRPVQTEKITDHRMHEESFYVSEETAARLSHRKEAAKQICVGTTTCRVLESIVQPSCRIPAGPGTTGIFIYPGYSFKYVKSLLTNFHLPGSSLLMLVCAFGGYDLMMEAYLKAVKDRFRFYSYGDAMLIL